MTATIHRHPAARHAAARPTAGLGYPAAFGSAAGPGFQWSVPAQPTRAAAPVPLAERAAAVEAGLGRLPRRVRR